jgi:hypothetical protein
MASKRTRRAAHAHMRKRAHAMKVRVHLHYAGSPWAPTDLHERNHYIKVTKPTLAWLTAAPLSDNTRTHSTCPFWLAIYSGEALSVCNTTRHTNEITQTLPSRLALTASVTRMPSPSPKTAPCYQDAACTTHHRLVDSGATVQQSPYALHVPLLAGNEQRSGPVGLQNNTPHSTRVTHHAMAPGLTTSVTRATQPRTLVLLNSVQPWALPATT